MGGCCCCGPWRAAGDDPIIVAATTPNPTARGRIAKPPNRRPRRILPRTCPVEWSARSFTLQISRSCAGFRLRHGAEIQERWIMLDSASPEINAVLLTHRLVQHLEGR